MNSALMEHGPPSVYQTGFDSIFRLVFVGIHLFRLSKISSTDQGGVQFSSVDLRCHRFLAFASRPRRAEARFPSLRSCLRSAPTAELCM